MAEPQTPQEGATKEELTLPAAVTRLYEELPKLKADINERFAAYEENLNKYKGEVGEEVEKRIAAEATELRAYLEGEANKIGASLEALKEAYNKDTEETRQKLQTIETNYNNAITELTDKLQTAEETYKNGINEVTEKQQAAEERHSKDLKDVVDRLLKMTVSVPKEI